MATVQVSTWNELLSALSDASNNGNDVEWIGASTLSTVTLHAPSEYDSPTITTGVSNINFNGLTIEEMIVTDSGHNYHEGTYKEFLAWTQGFPCLSANNNIGVRNLIINHLRLTDPRNIIIRGRTAYNLSTVGFQCVYVFDITAPSVEPDSIWLTDSGRNQFIYDVRLYKNRNSSWRAESEYLVRGGGFYNCCFKFNIKNASISLPAAQYFGCDLFYNYEYDWNEEDVESSIWSYMSIFSGKQWGGILSIGDSTENYYCYFIECNLQGEIKIKSDHLLLLAEATYHENAAKTRTELAKYFKFGIPNLTTYGRCLTNLRLQINDSDFQGIQVFDVISENASQAQNLYSFWVYNNGNLSWGNIPEHMKIALGDAQNADVLTNKGLPITADDGWRKGQWSDGVYYNINRRMNAALNNGVPFVPMWYYPYVIPPSPSDVPDGEYITVWDMQTEQDEFTGNGLAILKPTLCRVTEELNGGYSLTLEHPKDKEGKWRFILEMNIIKCLGQLFIIRKVKSSNRANKKVITAYAEHISYHLNDYWLYPGTSIAGYQGQSLINSILVQMDDSGGEWQTKYTFGITTDMNADPSFKEWYEMSDGHTPYEMILGENGFTQLIGGELYRDNFNISINSRMQGAQDNAFVLHPDLNLEEIEREVDLLTFCTYFKGFDNFGGWFAVAWDPSTLPRAYPHNIVRSQNFTYDEDYYSIEMLERDSMAYFKANCAPLVSFKFKVRDLKRHPEYKDFTNNYRFKVGDIGKVWDDESEKYLDLELTKTVKDGITGECIEAVIGTTRSFTRKTSYNISIDRNYDITVEGEFDPFGVITITSNPDNAIVARGSSATFTVTYTGAPQTIQWQISDDEETWTDIEGANTATYTVEASASNDEHFFRCVLSNRSGTEYSDSAWLIALDSTEELKEDEFSTNPFTLTTTRTKTLDYTIYGSTNSLKSTSYDTAHSGYTLNITTGALASDSNAAVTPYYEIPNDVGFFAVRFDASSVSSWDYINLCIYEYDNTNYTFRGHTYPTKTIISDDGYITKVFYCKYASDSNKIVCRFVVPVGIINDSTKFDIYTAVGEVPKAQWFTGWRDNTQGGTFGYCRIEAQVPTDGGNYTLAFKSYRSLKNYLYYWHIDEQGNKTRIQDTPVTITDNPANLTLPSGCNYIVCIMEDTVTWNRAISAGEVDDIRIWKTNDIEFDIPVTVSDLAPVTVRTNNLFDYETMAVSVENYYLNEDGSTSQSNNWNVSDYVPCDGTEFTVCNVSGGYCAICLYDANKQYITGKKYDLDGKPQAAVTITSQTTAKYIRFSYYKNASNVNAYVNLKYVQLVEGSPVLIPFEPYGYKTVIPDNANTMDCQISLDLPLRTGDTLNYANQKRYNADDTNEPVEMPEIELYVGQNTITVNTDEDPAKVEIDYVGEVSNGNG